MSPEHTVQYYIQAILVVPFSSNECVVGYSQNELTQGLYAMQFIDLMTLWSNATHKLIS